MSEFDKSPDVSHDEAAGLRAQAHIDDRLGRKEKTIANWRMATIGSTLVAALACGAAWSAVTMAETEVFYVPIDDAGRPTDVKLAKSAYTPGERSVSYFLGRFVENFRAVPMDKQVLRQNWKEAWDFTTDSGRVGLNKIIEEQQPFQTAAKEARRVQIESIVQTPGAPNSYEIEWVEQTATPQGEGPVRRYRGLFTVEFMEPQSEDQLRVNPLGIFITDFTFAPVR